VLDQNEISRAHVQTRQRRVRRHSDLDEEWIVLCTPFREALSLAHGTCDQHCTAVLPRRLIAEPRAPSGSTVSVPDCRRSLRARSRGCARWTVGEPPRLNEVPGGSALRAPASWRLRIERDHHNVRSARRQLISGTEHFRKPVQIRRGPATVRGPSVARCCPLSTPLGTAISGKASETASSQETCSDPP
jgi:hypothetical protein